MTIRASLLLWVLVASLTSCRGDAKSHELFIDLKTDLVPGGDFTVAEVFVEEHGGPSPIYSSYAVTGDEDFVRGHRVAEQPKIPAGSYRVTVRLLSPIRRALVAERSAAIQVRGDRLVTVVITRDCVAVRCDDPARSACLQGHCVPETCTPEAPETCAMSGCEIGSECATPGASCAEAICDQGICFQQTVTPPVCDAPLYCDPEEGCLALPGTPFDAGVDRDSGLDAGAEDGGPDAGAEDAGPDLSLCRDALQNGDETGVDCGGSCPAPCSTDYGCAAQSDIPPSECWALVDLYASTNGPAWDSAIDWFSTSPCGWERVRCLGGHVENLSLDQNGLDGPIPESISELQGLRRLSMFQNRLRGSLPRGLGSLPALEEIYVNTSGLSGTIPPEIGNLGSLVTMLAGQNMFSGPIPPELGNLSNLDRLELGNNDLTGAIPPELGNLDRVTVLNFTYNALTGNIPPELADAPLLSNLSLANNNLSGPLPPELGSMLSLQRLGLAANNLTGSIPVEFGNLSNLVDLSLHQNSLTGPIPVELGNLSNLFSINLSDNRLSGAIPPELGGLTNVVYIRLLGNQLTGTIPAELGDLTLAITFDLSDNMLSGALPSQLMSIPGTSLFRLRGNGCFNAGGGAFVAWLTSKDPLWQDGCL